MTNQRALTATSRWAQPVNCPAYTATRIRHFLRSVCVIRAMVVLLATSSARTSAVVRTEHASVTRATRATSVSCSTVQACLLVHNYQVKINISICYTLIIFVVHLYYL